MTLIPEIRGQLLDAAFGSAEPSGRAPQGRWSGRVAIAASVIVSLAVAGVVLLGLHGSPASPSTSEGGGIAPPPRAWGNAILRAEQTTRRRDPSCFPTVEQTHRALTARSFQHDQRFLTTAPPRSITANLPSLASPARGDQRVTVKELRALDMDANDIYQRYAWQGHADGIHYYVVPAAVVGATRAVSAHCYREELAAFRKD